MVQWALNEIILPLAATLITLAIAWAAATFTRWTGIQIEAKHREALHSALMTGVRMAIERLGAGAPKQQILNEALAHVEASVPDALKHFTPGVETLQRLAEGKLQEALAPLQAARVQSGG